MSLNEELAEELHKPVISNLRILHAMIVMI